MMVGTYDSYSVTQKKSLISNFINPRTLLILLAFCEKNIVRYFVLAFSMLPIIGQVSSLIVPTLYIFILICYCLKERIKLNEDGLPFLLFTILSILVTCFLHPENSEFIFDSNNFWNTIFPCLRWFLIGIIILPNKKTIDLIGKVSCVAVLIETLFLFLYMRPRGLLVEDDMNRSYQLLINVLFVVNYAVNKKRIIPWLFAIMGFLYLLFLGTRGPLVISFVFLVLKILTSIDIKIGFKVFFAFLVCSIIIVFITPSLFQIILPPINSLLKVFGFSTRVFDSFLYEKVSSSFDSGRSDLYSELFSLIIQKPLFGYGVYGEWQFVHWNAHNFYIEILFHFGFVIGIPFLLWIFWIVLHDFFSTPNRFAKELILLFACNVFVRGFFGGSWLSFAFFLLIGFCIKEKNRIKSRTADLIPDNFVS